MTLDPPMDNTPDITALPDIQMDFSGMFDAFEQLRLLQIYSTD